MTKRASVLALCVAAMTACTDRVIPTAAVPSAAGARTTGADADWGEAEVAAEYAAFQAAPGTQRGTNVVDPALRDLLETASATAQLEVVVTYDPAVTSGGAVDARLRALGAGTVGFKHLPMVYALATPATVREVAAMPGVAPDERHGAAPGDGVVEQGAQRLELVLAPDEHATDHGRDHHPALHRRRPGSYGRARIGHVT